MSTATLAFQRDADTIPPIEITDRCDKCGARSLVVTMIPVGDDTLRLDWCAHHFRQHQDKLLETATAIRDETERLVTAENAE